MATFLAFLGACAFALGTVFQQKGTLETPTGGQDRAGPAVSGADFAAAGMAGRRRLQVAGWILQAIALKTAAMMVVQTIMATSLVIALSLRAKITNQQISRPVVGGAAAMVAGIVLFLFVGSPQGGMSQPAAAWWSAIVAATTTTGLLAFLRWRRAGRRRPSSGWPSPWSALSCWPGPSRRSPTSPRRSAATPRQARCRPAHDDIGGR